MALKSRETYQDWKDNLKERRRWVRYAPTRGTLAWLEGRSYRMMDISLGGFSIYDYGNETVPEEVVLGLHCFEEGHFLDAVRCRKVSDHRVVSQSQYGEMIINRIGLQIIDDDPDLELKLTPFMEDVSI